MYIICANKKATKPPIKKLDELTTNINKMSPVKEKVRAKIVNSFVEVFRFLLCFRKNIIKENSISGLGAKKPGNVLTRISEKSSSRTIIENKSVKYFSVFVNCISGVFSNIFNSSLIIYSSVINSLILMVEGALLSHQ